MNHLPDQLPEPSEPGQPNIDLAGLAASRRALDARETGHTALPPTEPPRPLSDLTATMPIILPPDIASDGSNAAHGRPRRVQSSEFPGRHRGGMRIPRRALIIVGVVAVGGAAIALAVTVNPGSPPGQSLGARLPGAGAGLTAVPQSTSADEAAATTSVTPAAGTSTSPTRSHPSSHTPAPQPSTSRSAPSPTAAPDTTPDPAPDSTPGTGTAPPTPTPTPSPDPSGTPAIGTCQAAWTVTSSWSTGFQLAFTVTDSGSTPISEWSVSYSWPGSQRISQTWDAAFTQSHGATVGISNLSYNGAMPPGGSTTFGLLASGRTPSTLTGLQCTAR